MGTEGEAVGTEGEAAGASLCGTSEKPVPCPLCQGRGEGVIGVAEATEADHPPIRLLIADAPRRLRPGPQAGQESKAEGRRSAATGS